VATTTFLFVDQVASTEQLTRLGDEAAQQVRRTLFDLLRQATQVHRGREVDFTGDGLFCAFDGAADAVDAAVAMQQEAASISARQPVDHALSVRIGLHTGEPLRSEDRGYFGSAVVVAARLCARAHGGQILASSLVRALVEPRGRHRFVPEGVLPLKGLPEPVEAFTVAWEPAPHRAGLPTSLSAARSGPFVGRAHEIDAVVSAWQRVADGGGRRLILISGDAGIGMTRLMAEAAELIRLSGASVWAGAGHGREARLVAWADAIDGWARSTPRAELRLAVGDRAVDLLRIVPRLAELLPGQPIPASTETEAAVFLVADAVDTVVQRWTDREPLLICLDRLHEADPASLTLLRRLLQSRRGGRVLVLASYEPSSVGGPRVLTALAGVPDVVDLRLSGLTGPEVRELLAAVMGEPASDDAVRAVLAESEGNPYYVLQMARSLRRSGATRRVEDAVGRAVELRADLRLQREEITLGLRQLDQLRDEPSTDVRLAIDPDGTPPEPAESPYRGLLAYTAEHAESFFGREALVAEMVASLSTSRWLAVVGPSGSGKSSAVRAGLQPALRKGALPASETWVLANVRPGSDPLGALGTVLAEMSGADDGPAIATELRSAPLSGVVSRRFGGGRLVLHVDQFEELWTSAAEDARGRTLDLLVEAARDPGEALSVVVTMRADYYGCTAEHPGLAAFMSESQVLVPAMTPAELRAAVEMPARRAGLMLEPGLAQAVVDDVAGQPGALPLLSTAMQETWERRRGRSLTLAGYAETGGARRAIAHLADATFDEFDAEQQEIARRMLLRLAAPAADGGDVARPAPLSELVVDDATRQVLTRLTERRLVTTNETSAQPAHEALLREWPRLRRWLDADRDGRRLHQQVATAAAEWAAAGREDDSLLRGARLAAADDWRADHAESLSGREKEFLDASLELRQRDLWRARRTTRRFQVLAGVLVLLAVGAGASTFLAINSSRAAAQRATEAIARDLVNQTRQIAGTQLDTALLLAVEGYRRHRSIETRGGLLTALDAAQHLVGFRRELPAGVLSSTVTADRRTLLVATTSGEIQAFDTADWTRRPTSPMRRTDAGPAYVAMSPDGRHVAYGGEEGVQLADLAGGPPGPPLPGGGGILGFSSDGRVLLLAQGADVVLVDVATGAVTQRFPVANPTHVAVRPGADEVVATLGSYTGADTPDQLQRLRSDGTPLGPPVDVPGGQVFDMSYTPDGERLLVAANDGSVRLFDADSLTPTGDALSTGTADPAFSVRLSPDGETAALGFGDGSILLASVNEFGVLGGTRTGPLPGGSPALHWLDDERFIVITSSRAAEFDMTTPTPLGRPHGGFGRTFVAVPGGGQLLFLTDGRLRAMDSAGRPERLDVELPIDPLSGGGILAVAPDGSAVAVMDLAPGEAMLGEEPADLVYRLTSVDLPSGRTRFSIAVRPGDVGPLVAWRPDGEALAVVTAEDEVSLVDGRSGRRLGDAVKLPQGSTALKYSPSGDVLMIANFEGLRPLNTDTRRSGPAQALAEGDFIISLDLVPGTQTLLAGVSTGAVYVAEFPTGRPVGPPLQGGTEGLAGLAVSPDGDRFATLGSGGSIRLWDLASRRQLGSPVRGFEGASGVAYLDDKTLVTSGTGEGTLFLDLDPDSWRATACRLAGRDLTREEWETYLPGEPYRRTCHGRRRSRATGRVPSSALVGNSAPA
jgi:class 3 adenylate cyclase/WD40 repeat protein